MAHFAKLNEDNYVINVIVVSNSDCGNIEFPESEEIGKAYISSLGLEGNYVQTSYNSNFRRRYAEIGGLYILSDDIFTKQQPYASWVLDEDNEWQAPISKPNEDGFWIWNESNQEWIR